MRLETRPRKRQSYVSGEQRARRVPCGPEKTIIRCTGGPGNHQTGLHENNKKAAIGRRPAITGASEEKQGRLQSAKAIMGR